MSIAALRKVTLCGLSQEKTQVLQGLQHLGCLHLISSGPASGEPEMEPSPRPTEAYRALKYLLAVPRRRRQIRADPSFDLGQTVSRVLVNEQQTRATTDRRDFIAHRIQELAPWGDFEFPPLSELGGCRLWFYAVPRYQIEQVRAQPHPWQVIRQDHRHAYVVIIAREEPDAQWLPVPRTHTGSVSPPLLKNQLEQLEIELEDLYAQREAMTRWISLISQNLASAEDQAALDHAVAHTLDQEELFVLQGWIATDRLPALQAYAQQQQLALWVQQPVRGEMPPTLLNNPNPMAAGQDVVGFYQTPGYWTWDPSAVVFFSFTLFFAMIVADAGYALILGLLLAFYWRRLGGSERGQRLRLLATALVGASFLFGVLTGVYLGYSPPAGSPLSAVRTLDLEDFQNMIQLSIIIGCMHVMLANGLVAYHGRELKDKAPPIGWIAVVGAGLCLWFDRQGPEPGSTLGPVGVGLLIVGLGLVLAFSTTREVRSVRDAGLRLLGGLAHATQVTKIFGDVMSYIRLFALGLATASLALTFNQLAAQVAAALPGLGLLLSLIVLVLGHSLNLALAVVSGIVHGLRLNFIEFFSWGILEEGYPFRPFSKREPRQ